MKLTAEMYEHLKKTADAFQGSQRRKFMAETVEAFGLSQRQAEDKLGWCRDTLRKAQAELRSGILCLDNFSARGRKPIEYHLPNLLTDIRDLVSDNLQTDPTFQTTGLYCRLSAPEIHQQLMTRKGYLKRDMPCVQTIGLKLNDLGFRLRSVVKSRPQKN